MTSSLVGSEMCIRDRPKEKAVKKVAEKKAANTQSKAAQLAAAKADPKAVSYTHLTLPTICSV
eukprot:2165848-Prorocentrum_lima.AAC.1